MSEELKDSAKNLVKGEKWAVKHYHNIIKSNDFATDFDNKKTEIARETKAELRDLAYSKFASRDDEIRNDILTLIKQTDKFLPDMKLAKYFNIEDEPTLRLASNFKHYWRQLKAWLRLESELTARRDKALLELE